MFLSFDRRRRSPEVRGEQAISSRTDKCALQRPSISSRRTRKQSGSVYGVMDGVVDGTPLSNFGTSKPERRVTLVAGYQILFTCFLIFFSRCAVHLFLRDLVLQSSPPGPPKWHYCCDHIRRIKLILSQNLFRRNIAKKNAKSIFRSFLIFIYLEASLVGLSL